jgi:hypothetical protein
MKHLKLADFLRFNKPEVILDYGLKKIDWKLVYE